MGTEFIDPLLRDLDTREKSIEERLGEIHTSMNTLYRMLHEQHILVSALSNNLSETVVEQNSIIQKTIEQRDAGDTKVDINEFIAYIRKTRDRTENAIIGAKASAAQSFDVLGESKRTQETIHKVILFIGNEILPNLHTSMSTLGLMIAKKQRLDEYRIPLSVTQDDVSIETFNNAVGSRLLDRHPPVQMATAANSLSHYQ